TEPLDDQPENLPNDSFQQDAVALPGIPIGLVARSTPKENGNVWQHLDPPPEANG
ncbi:hypothetical protein CRM22_008965, partial [Opisthorchis felineus]